jgi:hypothetical protein
MRESVETGPRKAYVPPMIRFFDMSDRARLPQRFSRLMRTVLARA